MGQSTGSCEIDNDRVRVTRWTLAPSLSTGLHKHEFDYVITPVCDGEVSIEQSNADPTMFTMKQGLSYFREAGVEHDVINIGPETITFVEVELKEGRPGSCD